MVFLVVWLAWVGFHACALLAGSDLISLRPGSRHPGGQFTPFLLITLPSNQCTAASQTTVLVLYSSGGISNLALIKDCLIS